MTGSGMPEGIVDDHDCGSLLPHSYCDPRYRNPGIIAAASAGAPALKPPRSRPLLRPAAKEIGPLPSYGRPYYTCIARFTYVIVSLYGGMPPCLVTAPSPALYAASARGMSCENISSRSARYATPPRMFSSGSKMSFTP